MNVQAGVILNLFFDQTIIHPKTKTAKRPAAGHEAFGRAFQCSQTAAATLKMVQ